MKIHRLYKNLSNDTPIRLNAFYETAMNGTLEIIGIDKDTCKVRFVDTGYIRYAKDYHIKRGVVKDKLRPRIYGVGCIGTEYDKLVDIYGYELVRYMYERWKNILQRCYVQSHRDYDIYGGNGVYVSDDWLNFCNFFKDAINLPYFDKDKFMSGELSIDKDYRHQSGTKSYSKDTCCWLTISEQNSLVDFKTAHTHEKSKFKVIFPDGKEIITSGIREFARNHNLCVQSISSCLHEKCKTHKGYQFFLL